MHQGHPKLYDPAVGQHFAYDYLQRLMQQGGVQAVWWTPQIASVPIPYPPTLELLPNLASLIGTCCDLSVRALNVPWSSVEVETHWWHAGTFKPAAVSGNLYLGVSGTQPVAL